jgi:hypothetical protein
MLQSRASSLRCLQSSACCTPRGAPFARQRTQSTAGPGAAPDHRLERFPPCAAGAATGMIPRRHMLPRRPPGTLLPQRPPCTSAPASCKAGLIRHRPASDLAALPIRNLSPPGTLPHAHREPPPPSARLPATRPPQGLQEGHSRHKEEEAGQAQAGGDDAQEAGAPRRRPHAGVVRRRAPAARPPGALAWRAGPGWRQLALAGAAGAGSCAAAAARLLPEVASPRSACSALPRCLGAADGSGPSCAQP